jgi:hypothetical protein
MFPRAFSVDTGAAAAGERAVYEALQRRLDERWWVFHDRTIEAHGEAGRLDFVVLHPDRGIALVAVVGTGEEVAEGAARDAMAEMLASRGFAAVFGGVPAIVVASIDPARLDAVDETLDAAFDAAPSVPLSDPDWVEWVADLLARPEDLAIAKSAAALDDDEPAPVAMPAPPPAPAASGYPATPRWIHSFGERRRLAFAAAALTLAIVAAISVAWAPRRATTVAAAPQIVMDRPEPPMVDERAAGLDARNAALPDDAQRADADESGAAASAAPPPRAAAARRAEQRHWPAWRRRWEPAPPHVNQDNRPN